MSAAVKWKSSSFVPLLNGLVQMPCKYKSEGMVDGQAKDDESGQVQAEKPSLVSGGLLRMISPVSDTFK